MKEARDVRGKVLASMFALTVGIVAAADCARADTIDEAVFLHESVAMEAPDSTSSALADDGAQQDAEVAAADAEEDADEGLELELDDRPTSFPDPLEPLNRRTLSLNQTVDRWVFAPVTRAYGYVMPERAKRSVRDFFSNLESPAIFVNDVLQGEVEDAAVTVARFSVNTVFGLAGLFDPASSIGLERHSSDFGQTLARTGVGSGPFLIVPLLGPTTVRDGFGTLVDVAMQPALYLLGPAPLVVASVQEGTEGLTIREEHGADLERLEQGSLDYYAALRSAYYQNRMASLDDGTTSTAEAVVSVRPSDEAAPVSTGEAVASAVPAEEPPT